MSRRSPSSAGVRALTRAALIAALYAALSLLLAPVSFGAVQIRLAEALAPLPILLPEAVPALFVGCLIANVLGGCTALDIALGSLATLLAAAATRRLRARPQLACAMPVVFNGVIVGALVHAAYAPSMPPALCMIFVAAGETVSCCVLGPALLRALRRLPPDLLT